MANNSLSMRLESARKGSGMSTRAVAELVGKRGYTISHATIANYERGKTVPTLEVVATLADVYALPVNWFLQRDAVMTSVCYRALKKVSAREKREFEGKTQCWLDGYRRLEVKLCDVLSNKLDDFRVRKTEPGVRVAERLRERLELGDRPVASIIDVLHQFGVRVLSLDTSAAIDGLAAKLEDQLVIVLNSALPNDRVRLNAAHELGHHLYSDLASGRELPESEREKVAFEFASHFIMPVSKLRAAFDGSSMLRLIEYKRRYGISLAAMIYRAKKAELLSEKVYRMLWREFARRGWRKTEPGDVGADRPVRFEQMLESAIQRGVLTWAQAARVTGIPEGQLREQLAKAVRVMSLSNERGAENHVN